MPKVKVIELVGQKLDPKAKYLILFDKLAMPRDSMGPLVNELEALIGPNFVIGITYGNPNEVTKVYEFIPNKRKAVK